MNSADAWEYRIRSSVHQSAVHGRSEPILFARLWIIGRRGCEMQRPQRDPLGVQLSPIASSQRRAKDPKLRGKC